ncbi:MAG: lipocalin family protein [Acidobacteriaceae bacterium]
MRTDTNTRRTLRRAAAALMLIGCAMPFSGVLHAQSATAVPKLDLDRFVAPWYEIMRSPIHREKACLGDQVVLYALGDKKNSFQRVTSCRIKGDNSQSWNATGKLDEHGSGTLKIRTIWPFSSSYWVLATGPAYEWMLVGTPNHRTMWILSKTPVLPPEMLADAQAKAAAGGFNTSKLVKIEQHEDQHQ